MTAKKAQLTEEEIEKRIKSFRKVIRYRKTAGIVIAVVGLAVFAYGLQSEGDLILKINGFFCFAYGAFMRWQSARYEKKLSTDQGG